MFKQVILLTLCLSAPLQGMDTTREKNPALSDQLKKFLFWSIASMPAYQGAAEGYEILKEHLCDWQQTPATSAHNEVVRFIHEAAAAAKIALPECRIHIKEQSKPVTAGYTTIMLSKPYHDQLKHALDSGNRDQESPLLQYHLARASVYMNSYMKPKFIALAVTLPLATGAACQFLDSYLPQDGIMSWIIMLVEACATSTLNTELIKTFLNHMQDTADNAVPHDAAILKAGIEYLKHHSDPEKVHRRLHRINAFQKRLEALS